LASSFEIDQTLDVIQKLCYVVAIEQHYNTKRFNMLSPYCGGSCLLIFVGNGTTYLLIILLRALGLPRVLVIVENSVPFSLV